MRLFTRILVAMIAIVVLATGLVGLFIYRGVRTTLRPIELDRVKTHAQVLAHGLEAYVQGSEADVLGASKFPPVQGIVRTQPGGTSHRASRAALQSWRRQLASIFLAKLETNPKYLEFRFIGKADGGREIVRVDRSGPNGILRIAQGDQLQAKGKRSYFKNSITLPQGSVFVSPIELNWEWVPFRRRMCPFCAWPHLSIERTERHLESSSQIWICGQPFASCWPIRGKVKRFTL